MSGQDGSGLDGRFYSLWYGGSVSAEDSEPNDAPYAEALARARPALDGLFDEWAARGHIPLVPFAQAHEVIDGTLIEDLSSPDDGDPKAIHFTEAHRGGPCLVAIHRELEHLRCFDLQLLVTDRVLESELEPMLQRISVLLR